MLMSDRAKMVARRTYCRPKEDGSFETWGEAISRTIQHQRWLWERTLDRSLNDREESELQQLHLLMLEGKVLLAGRVMWMGGTDVAKRISASQFNCSFSEAETVNDLVDIFWLFLQGCGVGFKAKIGSLSGFSTPIRNVEVVSSERTDKGGQDHNEETYVDGVWTIRVGDSAHGWAKALGKLVAGKYPGCKKLVFDCSEIRPAGMRLAGYGWISNGWKKLAVAFRHITDILNRRSGSLLRKMDIHDIVNHLGTVLTTSRESAQISFYDYDEEGWEEFARCKMELEPSNPQHPHRFQSNNTIMFHDKPSKADIGDVLDMMVESGGSEPGFCNVKEALRRAPWFRGGNPCFEILLANKGFCNLVEIDLGKFKDNIAGLCNAARIVARANYRQTLVTFDDGILSHAWTHNQNHLRLCGVSVTGIARVPYMQAYDVTRLRNAAIIGACTMADELGTERPKNVTCGKPSGTLSKVMDTTEGVHKPLGKHIFNNVKVSANDPIVQMLERAGYAIQVHPFDASSVLVKFPQEWKDIPFEKVNRGGRDLHVNLESAVDQLERYRFWMRNYCDQNMSCTISYDVAEIPEIRDWLYKNWDDYVGVSFLFRADPTKTAKDLGYAYLPQEVVDRETFKEYETSLDKMNFSEDSGDSLIDAECVGGHCPVR